MAMRSFKKSSWTPVAVADATNFTDGGYMAIIGGTTTQGLKITEVYVGGGATTGAVTLLVLSRDSTVGATLTALSTGESDAALDPATAAHTAPPVPFTASTTKPQRSATLGLMSFAFNAFGGQMLWQAAEDEEIRTLGNAASFGEVSLSAFTGGSPGLVGAHVKYEVQ